MQQEDFYKLPEDREERYFDALNKLLAGKEVYDNLSPIEEDGNIYDQQHGVIPLRALAANYWAALMNLYGHEQWYKLNVTSDDEIATIEECLRLAGMKSCVKELRDIIFVSQSAIDHDFKFAHRKKTGMEEEDDDKDDDNPEEL